MASPSCASDRLKCFQGFFCRSNIAHMNICLPLLQVAQNLVSCSAYSSCFSSSTIAHMNQCLNGGTHGEYCYACAVIAMLFVTSQCGVGMGSRVARRLLDLAVCGSMGTNQLKGGGGTPVQLLFFCSDLCRSRTELQRCVRLATIRHVSQCLA